MILPLDTKVTDLVEILNSGAKFERLLFTEPGYYQLPLFTKDNPVILNVVDYTDELGIAILAKDHNGCIKDFSLDFIEGVFISLTGEDEEINWGNYGFTKTPAMAAGLTPSKNFCLTGYKKMDKKVAEMMRDIYEKEPAVCKALEMVIRHIHGTYSDKYAKGEAIIDTKKMLYDEERGDFLNIYQVSRYLQRYITQGSAKSHLVKDIEKAVHYLIFELTRRILIGDIEEIEPKI